MKIYHYHPEYKYFIGSSNADESPLEPGIFLIPAYATNIEPIECDEDEIQYLISHEKRNKFIRNLAIDLKGNTLILYSRVEAHGANLYEMINNQVGEDRKIFFVHGGIDTEERELVRTITERENDAIIVASYATLS